MASSKRSNAWREIAKDDVDEAYSAAERQHVESAIAAYYLRSDGPFGAGALRYIDASPSHLATALSIDESCNPGKELGRACGGRRRCRACLRTARSL